MGLVEVPLYEGSAPADGERGAVSVPALKEAVRSPEFLSPPPATPQVNRKVFLDALEQDTLVQDPYVPGFAQIQTLVTPSCTPCGKGRRTPAACCSPSRRRSTRSCGVKMMVAGRAVERTPAGRGMAARLARRGTLVRRAPRSW